MELHSDDRQSMRETCRQQLVYADKNHAEGHAPGNLVMQVPSGGWVDFSDFKSSKYVRGDLFYSLCVQERFGGHSLVPYSIGQHSLLCYHLAGRMFPGNASIAFAALMHDAAEGLMLDVPTPLKRHVGGYREVYDACHADVVRRCMAGIDYVTEFEEAVKEIDYTALAAERPYCCPMNNNVEWSILKDVKTVNKSIADSILNAERLVPTELGNVFNALEAAYQEAVLNLFQHGNIGQLLAGRNK